ncbi:MAG: hypothetical protein ABSA81_01030 [Candidatus Bathyarchaeia archaeon]|jgi:hypothetical protein
MVFIVIQAWYPAKIARLVAQKYLEVTQKYPHDKSLGEMVFGPIQKATKDGIHVLSGWECKDDKIKDSLMALGKEMLMLAEIEGYLFSMDTYVDAIESFAMIGMKGPQ